MSTDEQALEDEWEEEVEAQPSDKCPACVRIDACEVLGSHG